MAYKIVWTPQAKSEFIEILEYWNLRNNSNAYSIKLITSLSHSLKILKKFPEIGKLSDHEHIRKLIVRDYNVYYKIEEENIILLKIWDVRKDPLSFGL